MINFKRNPNSNHTYIGVRNIKNGSEKDENLKLPEQATWTRGRGQGAVVALLVEVPRAEAAPLRFLGAEHAQATPLLPVVLLAHAGLRLHDVSLLEAEGRSLSPADNGNLDSFSGSKLESDTTFAPQQRHLS